MRLNFRWKLFFGFFTMSVVISGLLIVVVYWRVARLPERLASELLMTAAANAVKRIDAADVTALSQAEDPRSSPLFAKLHQVLRDIDAAPPHFHRGGAPSHGYDKDIYILVRTPTPGMARLVVTINPAEAGRLYDMTRFPAMIAGWEELSSERRVSSDEFGHSLSAYAPIKTASGQSVALLGMDAPAQAIEEFRREIATTAGAIFLVSLLVSLAPAFFIAHRLNRPIRLLDEGMRRVAQGRLDTPVPRLRTYDEFEPLIDNFNQMTADLRQWDQVKRSLELAREIQQHLLPPAPPQIPGFEITGEARFCDQTGGDYFDFITADGAAPASIGIAVADVTGHGLPAALLMASARALLRSRAMVPDQDLAALLRLLNVALVGDTDGERFVTMFYGVLDFRTRELRWAAAGHEPLLWLCAQTGQVAAYNSTGIPLGIMAATDYGQGQPVNLSAGDVLVVTTDGIRETQNPQGEQFGQQRLMQTVQAQAGRSAQQIHAAILRAADDFRGSGPQQDDLTLVVVRAL